jgi:hypothetical protein
MSPATGSSPQQSLNGAFRYAGWIGVVDRFPKLVAFCFFGLVLSACSPQDISAVTLSPEGVPMVMNCGTWIRGVEASDDKTDRVLWSAQIPSDRKDWYEHDVGRVELGRLPDEAWTESTPYGAEPDPEVWRFVINQGLDRPTTIVVRASALSAGKRITSSGKELDCE